MDQITIKNFRCFRDKQTARLAPLTLLVGENSTGKTSFMALIRALWDVAYRQKDPDFKKEPYDLGSFDEIAHHRGRGSRADTFEAGFAFTPQISSDTESFLFEATFKKKGSVPVPEHRRLSQKDAWIEYRLSQKEIHFGTKRGAWKRPLSDKDVHFLDWRRDGLYNLLSLFSILWHFIETPEKNHQWDALAGSATPTKADFKKIERVISASQLDPFLPHTYELYASAPVRSKPRRTYDPALPTRDPEGDYIPMYLSNLYFQHKKQWETLKEALEKFGQDAGLFDEISVKSFVKKETEPFQVQIRKYGKRVKGPQRNLIDVGYGVSQVLPIITELLSSDVLSTFLLQQPEVHLHPSAQAALGSLFCQIAGPKRQLVIETHSDHLLNRVRMDVRDGEGNLKPEDVSILFFERRSLDVHIHSLEIDDEGNVLNAPPVYRQFFIDEMERSIWKRRKAKGS